MKIRRAAVLACAGFVAAACRPPDPGAAGGSDAGAACAQFAVGAPMTAETFSSNLPAAEAAVFAQHALAASEVSQWAKRELAAVGEACGTLLGQQPSDSSPEKVIETCLAARGGKVFRVVATSCVVPVDPYAECQGACSAPSGQPPAKCDVKANPVACTGGRLIIDCSGTCLPGPSSSKVECQASPKNSSTGREPCQGKCTSQCVANTTCALPCLCDAACRLSGPSVRCDGVCDGAFDAFGCAGGRLAGGCTNGEKCVTACAVRTRTKQECPPASVDDTNPATAQAIGRVFVARGFASDALADVGQERESLAQFPTALSGCLIPVLDEAAVGLRAIASATAAF